MRSSSNNRKCCDRMGLKRTPENPTIYRCVSCGTTRYLGPNTMRCFSCDKLILKDRGSDEGIEEMLRLTQAGELEIRQIQCSFGASDQFSNGVMRYPVCRDCIRKERTEEEYYDNL